MYKSKTTCFGFLPGILYCVSRHRLQSKQASFTIYNSHCLLTKQAFLTLLEGILYWPKQVVLFYKCSASDLQAFCIRMADRRQNLQTTAPELAGTVL